MRRYSRRPPGQTRAAVLAYLREQLQRGASPSVREIKDALGLSAVQSVQAHLAALVEGGQLRKRAGARGYQLPGAARPARRVPILGRVQAGALTLAVEDAHGELLVDAPASAELFALMVRGESMRDAAILDGDVVLVRRQPTARSGQIVVALVGEEATVKRLWVGARRLELRPENPAFHPIVIAPPDEPRILGVVVEVRRRIQA